MKKQSIFSSDKQKGWVKFRNCLGKTIQWLGIKKLYTHLQNIWSQSTSVVTFSFGMIDPSLLINKLWLVFMEKKEKTKLFPSISYYFNYFFIVQLKCRQLEQLFFQENIFKLGEWTELLKTENHFFLCV